MSIHTLDGAGQATDWFDIGSLAGIQFQGSLTGAMTVVLETSNDTTYQAKAEPVVAETYTASFDKAGDPPLPMFIRFRVTAFAPGASCKISFGPAVNTRGEIGAVSPESYPPAQVTA
jgi:hypothetical protein